MNTLRFALLLSMLGLALGKAGAANLSACQPEGGPELESACRGAIESASSREVLNLIDPWISAKHYDRAKAVVEVSLAKSPRDAGLLQRRHEIESMAEEAAWLARKERGGGASEIDSALAETRCTRLTGETALLGCEQALRLKPDDPKLLAAKGDLLMALGRSAEALGAYRASLKRLPNAAVEQKIALAEGASRPQALTLDQQLAALEKAREKKLINKAEYEKQRSALLSPPTLVAAAPAASGTRSTAVPGIEFGRYHALVIGNNAYRHLPKLDTAINDAKGVSEMLKSTYGFEVKLMTDATRADIVEILDEYRAKLKAEDNLLIYYAGHGWLDKDADKGFWLPVDAKEDKRTQWVSNDTVRDALRALKAKHVLVIADSCFSGTLTRGLPEKPSKDQDYIKRMSSRKARQVIASGGLEPVADSAGGGHSPFAAALIEALKSNTGVLDGTSLFADLRRPVAVNSEQVPQFADIRQAGHQGGDFLFVRRK